MLEREVDRHRDLPQTRSTLYRIKDYLQKIPKKKFVTSLKWFTLDVMCNRTLKYFL